MCANVRKRIFHFRLRRTCFFFFQPGKNNRAPRYKISMRMFSLLYFRWFSSIFYSLLNESLAVTKTSTSGRDSVNICREISFKVPATEREEHTCPKLDWSRVQVKSWWSRGSKEQALLFIYSRISFTRS